jgi:glycosyltransferase involved in cell wall biosynthesis
MRILAVGNMYPPHHLGGYELVWQSAVRSLRADGHTVRVLTTDFRTETAEPDDPEVHRELRWYWRDHDWPRIGWRGRIALERQNGAILERHLAVWRPEVVSWWSMGGMSLSLIERVRRAAIPAAAFIHDDWLLYAPRVDRWVGPLRRHPVLATVCERLTGLPGSVDLDGAARYLLVSETVRSRARAAGYALAHSSVARSGIDPLYLDPRPPRPWSWRLLYVGRIDQRKGVGDAVAALSRLPAEATLTLAGSGDRREIARVRDTASRFGVADRVRELGMCSPTRLKELYACADAVVFPVRWEEPWGLVPLEAMGIGRPVIATGRGGSSEYLREGENCLLVAAEQPRAIAEAARRLAEDSELRDRLRAGGLETARRYTSVAFNEAVLRALLEAAGAAEPEPLCPAHAT